MCFSSQAHNERIYDVLSGARIVLENGKPALGMFPVPGLAPVADALIALISKVEVRLYGSFLFFIFRLTITNTLGGADDSGRPRRVIARDFTASERYREHEGEDGRAYQPVPR